MEELIPKYEEWVTSLEAKLDGIARERRQMLYVMLASLVIAPVGFFWSGLVALAIAFLGVLIYGTTIYITEMRRYQWKVELTKTRDELERLREGGET
jgi:hypothetical protein